MLTKTFIFTTLAALLTVHAAAVPTKSQPRATALDGCIDACNAKNSGADLCDSTDVSAIMRGLECLFDCQANPDAADDTDSNSADNGSTKRDSTDGEGLLAMTSFLPCTASTSIPPVGKVATAISLPACAQDCLSSVPNCKPDDLSCICQSVQGHFAPNAFEFDKCRLGKCSSDTNFIVSTMKLSVDCGDFSASADPSQLPFPENQFMHLFQSTVESGNSSSASTSSSAGSADAVSTAQLANSASTTKPASSSSPAATSPAPSAKGNGAMSRGLGSVSAALAGVALGLTLL